jgi:hypothetical protein
MRRTEVGSSSRRQADPAVRETLSGLIGLLQLAIATRFRLRGRYWRWRMDTALGTDRTQWPSRAERFRAFLRYGAWTRRMRKAAN